MCQAQRQPLDWAAVAACKDFQELNFLNSDTLMTSALVCLIAVLLDRWLGEPRRWHPLVGFGHLVSRVERRLNNEAGRPLPVIIRGFIGVAVLVLPWVLLGALLSALLGNGLELMVIEALVLYLARSVRGLSEHGRAVSDALRGGDLALARTQVGRIVSRKAEALDETGIATAATESMLENGADAVFASLFWYLVAGLPGVLLHRLVNTLDAMWGYRNERFLYFGRFAARLDDVLNWIPARLTALTYALVGRTGQAIRCWRRQAAAWDSPNAGPVMAAGAGALGVTMGGAAPYPSGVHNRPVLGEGPMADAGSVEAAIRLVNRGVWLWLAVLFMAGEI
jgi:adenosylcobinamide-phosphate synthase